MKWFTLGFLKLRKMRQLHYQLKCQRSKREGFEWALGEYFNGNMSILNMELKVDCSHDFGDYNYFDAGVEKASRLLTHLRLTRRHDTYTPPHGITLIRALPKNTKRSIRNVSCWMSKGYEVSLADYFEGKCSILELEACTKTRSAFGKYTAYELGVDHARWILKNLNLTPEDKRYVPYQ